MEDIQEIERKDLSDPGTVLEEDELSEIVNDERDDSEVTEEAATAVEKEVTEKVIEGLEEIDELSMDEFIKPRGRL